VEIIDAFPHILPKPLFERMLAAAESPSAQSWLNGSRRHSGLYELDVRFRAMDARPGYCQILTLATPPLEQVASGAALRDLATLANDSLADLCEQHRDRFVGFAAGLPMSDPEAAVDELERAIQQLGAKGAQIFTNVDGHPLDEPRFEPLFAKLSELNKPIWVHGARSFIHPEFAGEDESRYGLWLALGWPYEMGLFMARAVLAGILDRYPNLRFLTHHGGGMIPTFGQRVATNPIGFQGQKHASEMDAFKALTKSPVEYFKMFYADTTVGGEPRTLRAALDFFGPDQVLFASDWPFGPPTEDAQIGPTLNAIHQLGLSDADQEKMLGANAQRLIQ
jgi:uncharacterized protein